jgi:hypothetical protein
LSQILFAMISSRCCLSNCFGRCKLPRFVTTPVVLQCRRHTDRDEGSSRMVYLHLNGEGSFSPSAHARLDLQPLAIPQASP